MAVNYPGSLDSFNEPSLPEYTSLSSAGDGTRAHVEHHAAAAGRLVVIAALLAVVHQGFVVVVHLLGRPVGRQQGS